MTNKKILRSFIIAFIKKIRIYYFLKFSENIFVAFKYYFAKLLSIIFYKQVTNLIPKSLNDKFTSTLEKPKNLIEEIMCFALVRKLQKANYNNDRIINYWKSRNSLKWFNELNENNVQYSYEHFEKQSNFILTKLNNLIKKEKINDLLLIDISVGNGFFLNFFAERIRGGGDVLPVGFDINRLVIEQNKINNKLNHIQFKHGLLQEHKKYFKNLTKKNIFFLSRKSLTCYNNEELNHLLTFISRISGLHYFIVIEANNFNYKIKKETKYRDHPLYYSHNYPLIFKKHNWLLIDRKIKYTNFFVNYHIANFIFKKTT